MSAHIPPCDVETNGGECCCAAVWMDRARDAECRIQELEAMVTDHRMRLDIVHYLNEPALPVASQHTQQSGATLGATPSVSADVELDSPNFTPPELTALAGRGYERVNAPKMSKGGTNMRAAGESPARVEEQSALPGNRSDDQTVSRSAPAAGADRKVEAADAVAASVPRTSDALARCLAHHDVSLRSETLAGCIRKRGHTDVHIRPDGVEFSDGEAMYETPEPEPRTKEARSAWQCDHSTKEVSPDGRSCMSCTREQRTNEAKETVGDLVKRAAALMRASKRGEVQAHVKDGNGWIELTLPERRPTPEGPRTDSARPVPLMQRARAYVARINDYPTPEKAALALALEFTDVVRESQRTEPATPDGHGQPCYYCRMLCDSLAANPGRWPIGLPHSDEPGVVKWHHASCVMDRLHRSETALADCVDCGAQFRPELPNACSECLGSWIVDVTNEIKLAMHRFHREIGEGPFADGWQRCADMVVRLLNAEAERAARTGGEGT